VDNSTADKHVHASSG